MNPERILAYNVGYWVAAKLATDNGEYNASRVYVLASAYDKLSEEFETSVAKTNVSAWDNLRLTADNARLRAQLDTKTEAWEEAIRMLAETVNERDALHDQLAEEREAHGCAIKLNNDLGAQLAAAEKKLVHLTDDTGETWESQCLRARAQRDAARSVRDSIRSQFKEASERWRAQLAAVMTERDDARHDFHDLCKENGAVIERQRAQLAAVTERDWEALGKAFADTFGGDAPTLHLNRAFLAQTLEGWLRATFGGGK
jgi:small-conductance mechanosensitive channel